MRQPLLHVTGLLMISLSFIVPAQAGEAAFVGTGLGAAFGGLFGSQFGRGAANIAATGTGVIVGGVIGNSIGQSMDAQPTSYPAIGNSYAPDPSSLPIAYGAYTPNYVAPPAPPPIYLDQDVGTFCRPYSQEIYSAGRVQEAYGTACLQPDGTWRIIQ